MSKRQKATKQEQAEAVAELRQLLPPGSTVYTVLRQVSASGMSRCIDLYLLHENDRTWLSPLAFRACGFRWDDKRECIRIGGGGMDMGFALVHSLSSMLYRDGYACLGKGKCPSSYHVNHRDRVRCDGPIGDHFCYRSNEFRAQVVIGTGLVEGVTIPGQHLFVTADAEGHETVCPRCLGEGYIPNPEGPERFDLTHTDGYAISQRWL